MGRVPQRILLWPAIALAAIVLLVFVSLLMGISPSLEPLRRPVEESASQALGRRVRITGPLRFVPAFFPTLEIRDVRIANPPDWPEGELAHLDRTRLQIGVLSLLWGRAVLAEVRVEGGLLRLQTDAEARENWRFTAAPAPQKEAGSEKPENTEERRGANLVEAIAGWIREVELGELVLREIRVERRDARTGSATSFVIEEVTGSAATDAPLELEASGVLVDHPYRAEIDGGSLLGLFARQDEPWPLRLSLEVAETRLRMQALLDDPLLAPERLETQGSQGRTIGALEIEIAGERLSSLDALSGVDLPDWGPWTFNGRFDAPRGDRRRAEVALRVGRSDFAGTMQVELHREPPHFDIALTAGTIRLDDFPLGDWSPRGAEKAPAAMEVERAASEQRPRGLLSGETLGRLDAELSVESNRVLSGRDRMGASHLEAKLAQGRLSVRPWRLEVPGGSVELTADVRSIGDELQTELHLQVDRFDYGIVARRGDPRTEMSGRIDLDLDLSARSPTGERILPYANGHLDVGVFPEALEAGVFELWAVNLAMAVIPVVNSGGGWTFNCGVASLDLKDGIMTERSILIDTPRVRISGDATVDFHERRIQMSLRPRAKRPEFFSRATPVTVDGSFDDFGLGVKPLALVGTVLRLASNLQAPGRYPVGDLLPLDGSAECREVLERVER